MRAFRVEKRETLGAERGPQSVGTVDLPGSPAPRAVAPRGPSEAQHEREQQMVFGDTVRTGALQNRAHAMQKV